MKNAKAKFCNVKHRKTFDDLTMEEFFKERYPAKKFNKSIPKVKKINNALPDPDFLYEEWREGQHFI